MVQEAGKILFTGNMIQEAVKILFTSHPTYPPSLLGPETSYRK
jgi:hypothetical protein